MGEMRVRTKSSLWRFVLNFPFPRFIDFSQMRYFFV